MTLSIGQFSLNLQSSLTTRLGILTRVELKSD